MSKQELIGVAYRKAMRLEMKLSKEEAQFKKIQDTIKITRQDLVAAKDEIALLHREVSAPLLPNFDPKLA